MKHCITLLACLSLFFIALPAAAAVSEADINNAYYTGDLDALEAMRGELNESVASESLLAAYLDWRLASVQYGLGNEDVADATLERAQTTLEALLEQSPNSAEAWALLSSTLGMRISIRPMRRGFTYGMRSNAAMKRATELEPQNPRVLLIDAIALLNKPSLYGGDREEAMQKLDQALSEIAINGTGRFEWGKADIHTWRGIALQRQGNAAEAAQSFDEALVVVPSYRWAQQLRASVSID
ncbi:MAG: hypothetical protein AAF660_13175 [Pseudomonadota bacterium]